MPSELIAADVARAASWAASVFVDVTAPAWDITPTDGGWAPRRILDHLVDTLLLYCAYIATRATTRITPPRNGDPPATPSALTEALGSSSAILVRLVVGMADEERAFHPSGFADRTGWIGMACTELLVHGHDIATRTGSVPGLVPNELAHAVVDRVLPWTPREGDGWARLLWATGRASLGGREPDASDWWWHCPSRRMGRTTAPP
jgi:DinB family protein